MIEQIIRGIQNNPECHVGIAFGLAIAGAEYVKWRFRPPKPTELDMQYKKAIDRIYEVGGSLTDENEDGLKKFVEDLEGLCKQYCTKKE